MSRPLEHLRVAILMAPGVEEAEISGPDAALRQAGAAVTRVSPGEARIRMARGMDAGEELSVERPLAQARPGDFDAVFVPGGLHSVEALRTQPAAVSFLKEMQDCAKPIALLGHASALLISAKIARGRKLAAPDSLREDLTNSGAECEADPVVVDSNWVTGRGAQELERFTREMIGLFSRTTPPVINIAESA
jgi:protease I